MRILGRSKVVVVSALVAASALPASAGWIVNGVPLCVAPDEQEFPLIVPDGEGGAIVVWQDARNTIFPPHSYEVYAQRVDATGNVLWAADGAAVCETSGDQWYPDIVSDGSGGAIIAWSDSRSGPEDIYAQRVDGSGNMLWASCGVAVCNAADDQYMGSLVTDGVGGAIICWYDFRDGGSSDVYAQRLDPSGNKLWQEDGVPISIENDWQEDPRSVSDGAGGAIFTWHDWRNTVDSDLYAQRIDSLGNVQWADNGVAISTGPGDQAYPDITTDGTSGAIIVWHDGRNGPVVDVYAQRVDSSGNVLWAAGGIGVATEAWLQIMPMVVSDGVGGAIITWEDWNSSSSDIYAQRLNGSGTALWDIGGAPVCSVAVAGKRAPTIASDSASGAIITWYGGGDIFAQWIDSSGNVQWTADALAICTADGGQYFPTIVNDGEGGVIITWQGQGDFGEGIYAQKVALQPTGVEERSPRAVSSIKLSNYPNPFSTVTEFRFHVPSESEVTIEIFDIAGKRVFAQQLPTSPAGWASFLFDGRDLSGKVLPSGVYFSRITAGGLNATKKIVIAK